MVLTAQSGFQCMRAPSAMHTFAALCVTLCHITCMLASSCQQHVIADAQQGMLSYAYLSDEGVCAVT